MPLERNVGGRDRLVRTLLAVALTVVAVHALGTGRRALGLIAGLGALAAGFNAATCVCGLNAVLGVDTTDE